MAGLIPKKALAFAERLSFPKLFALTATLFVATLLVPDPIPFADEILLGLGTLLLAALRRRRTRPDADAGAASPDAR